MWIHTDLHSLTISFNIISKIFSFQILKIQSYYTLERSKVDFYCLDFLMLWKSMKIPSHTSASTKVYNRFPCSFPNRVNKMKTLSFKISLMCQY